MPRAVVIDPDPLWQQAVTAALTRSGVSVVANSGDLSRAPELADAHAADLLLVGLEEYKKLGVRNRIEASHWAIARGHVRPTPDDEPQDHPEVGGVREPRRPIKPTLIGGIALDLPENDELDADDEMTRDAPSEAA